MNEWMNGLTWVCFGCLDIVYGTLMLLNGLIEWLINDNEWCS